MNKNPKSKTSWEPVKNWYAGIVGKEGHYYHQHVIIPGVLKIMKEEGLSGNTSLLDLACGNGVLSQYLPKDAEYLGVDASPGLIKEARKQDQNPKHRYDIADISKPLRLEKNNFDFATFILAAQNIDPIEPAFKNAYHYLKPGGCFIIVLNHPAFRIPRQSSWQIDTQNKIQYRRVDRYLSSMKIPIQAHPSKGVQSASTFTFHHSLSYYSKALKEAGFVINLIDEWCSDKESTGKAAAMENRSRAEFPLFMTICALKQ
jgi:ubiquinone/menaquinone biosynthesis C-methylase UbiE